MEAKTLYILAPCYNEEEVLPLTSKIFLDKLNSLIDAGKISENSRVAFVDDGSKDKTWELSKACTSLTRNLSVLSFRETEDIKMHFSAACQPSLTTVT